MYLGYLPDGNFTGKVKVNTLNQYIHPLADANGAYDLGWFHKTNIRSFCDDSF